MDQTAQSDVRMRESVQRNHEGKTEEFRHEDR
jgi:hypothetical protein